MNDTPSPAQTPLPAPAILIELTVMGQAMLVAAIDESDGFEIRFQAPVNTARPIIERLARQKLDYARRRAHSTRQN